ncbi:MAG: hypothetical protein IRY90_22510, partial [Actinomadura rubrobrunea]|nr:hypothetical protein [Actinomadura rubrobrunea]
RVRRVFHITQLTKIFVLHRTLDEAIAAHESAAAAQRADDGTGQADPKRTA